MSIKYSALYNLEEHADKAFHDVDNDIRIELRNNNEEYAKMWLEASRLERDFPMILGLRTGTATVSMSDEEYLALFRYLTLKLEMEGIARKDIYYRGYMDCYAFLKQTGGVLIEL